MTEPTATDWKCAVCGALSPDRAPTCSCATNVVFSLTLKASAWKAGSTHDGKTPNLDRQIACLRREIALRKNVYPGWVRSKRMKPDDAKLEIEAMQAAHDNLMLIKEGRLIAVLGGTIPQREAPHES